MRKRMFATAAAAVATTLVLAGCTQGEDSAATSETGNSSSGTSASTRTSASATFNAADAMFSRMMIPHHEQAVEMADLVLGKNGVDARVTSLAEQIKAAQGPEIEMMKGWLTSWGMPYNGTSSSSGMDGMDGMEGMEGMGGGMLAEKDMAALRDATGAEATRLFLEGMIAHHEGAIKMARAELDRGKDPAALDLAQKIIDGQSAEITTMKEILGRG